MTAPTDEPGHTPGSGASKPPVPPLRLRHLVVDFLAFAGGTLVLVVLIGLLGLAVNADTRAHTFGGSERVGATVVERTDAPTLKCSRRSLAARWEYLVTWEEDGVAREGVLSACDVYFPGRAVDVWVAEGASTVDGLPLVRGQAPGQPLPWALGFVVVVGVVGAVARALPDNRRYRGAASRG